MRDWDIDTVSMLEKRFAGIQWIMDKTGPECMFCVRKGGSCDMMCRMKPITIAVPFFYDPLFEKMLLFFIDSGLVEDVIVVGLEGLSFTVPRCSVLTSGPITSQQTLRRILDSAKSDYLLLLTLPRVISVEPLALKKIVETAERTKAGITYCDFFDGVHDGIVPHPLNDYQKGCIRDDFDFGELMLFSMSAVRAAIRKYGNIPAVRYAGIYDLRLKVSIDHTIHHLPEPLYSLPAVKDHSGNEKIFAYVDPRQTEVQKEMEAVFTDHLRRIDAYLAPDTLRDVPQLKTEDSFPVEASVVIPVRNRKNTVADAIKSALSQDTDFPFNVIVVNNYSTDGTTALLSELANKYNRLNHEVPLRTDLGIGGCWNEALMSDNCGRYAVQLDSDDLYGSSLTLQRTVDMLRQGRYAMVVGSYTIVNFDLEEIPPGLIDHREWTDENGWNNALRINGFGAPRAFRTDVIRHTQFLNVNYGEDYAAGLKICREYRIGRIYESLYLCRRWPGNTDAALSVEAKNRNDAFKDRVRTDEIIARQQLNKERRGPASE